MSQSAFTGAETIATTAPAYAEARRSSSGPLRRTLLYSGNGADEHRRSSSQLAWAHSKAVDLTSTRTAPWPAPPRTRREQRVWCLPDRVQRKLPGRCNAALGAPRLNSRPTCAPGNRPSARSQRAARPAARSGALNSRPDGRPGGRTGRLCTSSLRLSGRTSARRRSGP